MDQNASKYIFKYPSIYHTWMIIKYIYFLVLLYKFKADRTMLYFSTQTLHVLYLPVYNFMSINTLRYKWYHVINYYAKLCYILINGLDDNKWINIDTFYFSLFLVLELVCGPRMLLNKLATKKIICFCFSY